MILQNRNGTLLLELKFGVNTLKKSIAFLLVLFLLASLCGCDREQGSHIINFQGTQVPNNIDPLLASTQSEKMVMENVFESLFSINNQGTVEPQCALGYSITNANTCVVTLRENLMWANGQAITPNDFIFALQRAVSPETKASCAGQLTCIKGATEILQGKQPATTLGVTATENGLVFTLVGKAETLLAALAGPAGIPCNQAFFEECKGRYGTSREHVLSNGPFGLKGWSKEDPDIFVRLVRNENYWGAQSVRPSGAYFTFGTVQEGYDLLSEGKIDGTLLSGDLISSAKEQEYTLLSHDDQTYGLLLNTKGRKEMKNASLRKALVGVIDRAQLATYLPLSCKGASGVVMPGSFYATKPYPQTNGFVNGLKEEATQNFNKALKDLGADDLKDFELWYVETEGTRSAVDYMVQCWQKEFGLYVTLKPVSQSELWYGLENGYCHLGIGKISQNGGNSLEMLKEFSFAGEHSQNGFTDKQYDKLLTTAEQSGELAHQQQCEAYLLNQGYLLPLYTTQTFYAFDKSVIDIGLNGYSRVLSLEKAGKTN